MCSNSKQQSEAKRFIYFAIKRQEQTSKTPLIPVIINLVVIIRKGGPTMRVFKVSAFDANYEEYKSIIVIAQHKERALEIAKKGQPFDWKDPHKYDVYWEFKKDQYPLTVKEIEFTEEKVISSELIGN